MIITLAAALSIAASLTIDVPYLPQTDALCGGAATAMVFRYWGDAHADVQEFAPLVDRRAGGIATDALTAAVASRGWRTSRVDGSLEALGARIHDGQPVVVLLPDRADRYHYVVVIGVSDAAVVVHDPAWGPSRTIRAADFERAWKAAAFWSLLILPPAKPTGTAARAPDPETPVVTSAAEPADACDVRLNRALDEIRAEGLDRADALLGEVRSECPAAPGPIRELSGVRFAQRRWNDAAALAREVLRHNPDDEYALDVLGSALFMQNDDIGALQAWNRIGKPRVNRVRIDGLHHTRYQAVAELMGIQPNVLLTAEMYGRARRRLAELPDHATTRLAVKPEADGFATVDVVVVEIAAAPHGAIEWAGASARAIASRELDVSVPGSSGQGEVWSAGWRWMRNRPGVSVGFAAPHLRGVPGVWRLEGAWTSDSYEGTQPSRMVETRSHGALTTSDWVTSHVRYSVTAGLDAWSGERKAGSIGGALEQVVFDDRLRMSVDATRWIPMGGGSAFASAGAHAVARSSPDLRDWVLRGTIGFERVGDAAPLTLWPGAGEGLLGPALLRAHPLLSDGVVNVTGSSAFGRTLAFGGAEVQRWMEPLPLVRLGIAGFTDVARASRQMSAGATPVQVDAGFGLRIKIPGTPGMLRADVAHGIRDGANALTVGWLF
jgi:hypothetical protein